MWTDRRTCCMVLCYRAMNVKQAMATKTDRTEKSGKKLRNRNSVGYVIVKPAVQFVRNHVHVSVDEVL